jgi:acyl-homoserine lactone acylase PvdQ
MHPDLAELVEELVPFNSNFMQNLVTILDEDDLKAQKQWSETTLHQRYLAAQDKIKAASPPLDWQVDGTKKNPEVDEIVNTFTDEQSASNSWVIHGKHTETGFPMLANDPHLGTSIPSFEQLQELRWEGGFMSGASVPGTPFVFMGRTASTSYGMTSALNDISDLWQEDITPDAKHYKVDGELRTINYIDEVIEVKGEDSVTHKVGYTHRGPLLTSTLLSESAVLFGGALPKLKKERTFSLGWGFGMKDGDDMIELVMELAKGAKVKDVVEFVDSLEGGFNGLP